MNRKTKVCSICGKEFTEWGNNPRPFSRNLCCDECNSKVILPIRMFEMNMVSKGLLIRPDDTPTTIKYVELKKFKDIQKYVGYENNPAYVTTYPVKYFNNLTFFCDEDGLLKDLQPNKLALELYGINVVGNLLVVPNTLDNLWK